MQPVSPFEPYPDPGPRYRGMHVFSLYIPAPDGTRLAADVYLPEGLPRGERIPAILEQTRYWRALELRAPFGWIWRGSGDRTPPGWSTKEFFVTRGYALVIVDVRGTGASFGAWRSPWESITVDDGAGLLDWICAQPWSNGRVVGMGVSYLGTTAELLMAANHPALRGVIAEFNHPDSFNDIAFPGGLMNERFICAWGEMDEALDLNRVPASFGPLLKMVGKGVKAVDGPDGVELLAQALLSHHENVNVAAIQEDITFRDQPISEQGLSSEEQVVMRFSDTILSSRVPVFGIASWMDAGTANAALRRYNTYPGMQRAMIGAWNHGGILQSSPYLPAKAPLSPAPGVQRMELLRFLEACLKPEEAQPPAENCVYYYTLGSETWQKSATWPPQGVQPEPWYFMRGQRLAPSRPTEAGSDRFLVDDRHTSGVYNRWWELGAVQGKRVDTTGREAQRERVLAYESELLENDLEIAGWPVVTLRVISSEPDCAFFVYLEDVFPDGRIVELTEGQLRSIHRKISTDPSPYRLSVPYHTFCQEDAWPLVPGELAEISFGLLPVSALIQKGHRLRVALAGHDAGTFPRVPVTATPIWQVSWGSEILLPIKH
jgi:uncharacterized protein